MRRVATAFVLTGLGLALLAGPAFAHHAFAGQYDKDTPIQLTGVVTKIEWMNPHARFYVDVKDESGNVTNWNIELGPPLILRRAGWRQDSLKVGDQVTLDPPSQQGSLDPLVSPRVERSPVLHEQPCVTLVIENPELL